MRIKDLAQGMLWPMRVHPRLHAKPSPAPLLHIHLIHNTPQDVEAQKDVGDGSVESGGNQFERDGCCGLAAGIA